MPRYAKLPKNLQNELGKITPSITDGFLGSKYFPCAVELKSGEKLPCVYFSEETSWHSTWGIWPEQDNGKQSIKINQVARIFESKYRLPFDIAKQIYQAGESGMGYSIFTLVFHDGSETAFGTGNAVDFINYPKGQSYKTIKKVIAHKGRHNRPIMAPEYYWCLYSE